MATPGASFPLTSRSHVSSTDSVHVPTALSTWPRSPRMDVFFTWRLRSLRQFLVTSLSLYYLVLGVLSATQLLGNTSTLKLGSFLRLVEGPGRGPENWQTKFGRQFVERGHRPKKRLFRQVSPASIYVLTSNSPSACRSFGYAGYVCLFFLVLDGFFVGFHTFAFLVFFREIFGGLVALRGARFHSVRGRVLPDVSLRTWPTWWVEGRAVLICSLGCSPLCWECFVVLDRLYPVDFPRWISGGFVRKLLVCSWWCFWLSPFPSFSFRVTSQEPILSNLWPRASRSSFRMGGTSRQTQGHRPKNRLTKFGPNGPVKAKGTVLRTG